MKKRLLFSFCILIVLLPALVSCSPSDSEPTGRSRDRDGGVTRDASVEESTAVALEPGMNSALVAIKLQSLQKEDVLDVDSPILLRVELSSPRSFAIQTYNEYRSESEEEVEAPEAMAGSEENPWWEGLRLFLLEESGERSLEFEMNPARSKAHLDLGNGEVGSVEIALSPDAFSQEGVYKLQAIWTGNGEDVRSDELTIELKRDAVEQQDKDISMIRYYLAAKQTEDALKIADAMAEREPENHLSHSYRGLVLEKMGNLEEAVSAYRQALGLYPEEQPGMIYEGPQGLLQRIHELEAKLGRR